MTHVFENNTRTGVSYRLDTWFDNGIPLVPLASFMATEEMENTLLRWLGNICLHPQLRQLATLNGFGLANQSCVVEYNQEVLQYLRKQLAGVEEYLSAAGFPELRWARETSAIKSIIALRGKDTGLLPSSPMSLGGMMLRRAMYTGDEYRLVNVFMLTSVAGRAD